MPVFTPEEWTKILQVAEARGEEFGLPAARTDSVVIGSFNIRTFANPATRPEPAWQFLEHVVERFDLVAIQEVGDDLRSIRRLHQQLGAHYGLSFSDVTGAHPADGGHRERLAFIWDERKVERGALTSEITFDRGWLYERLHDQRDALHTYWTELQAAIVEWQEGPNADDSSKRPKPMPPLFLQFIRQPWCASFATIPTAGQEPKALTAVNAHLLYGSDTVAGRAQRRMEFDALIDWLIARTKARTRLATQAFLLLADCNLDFDRTDTDRESIDAFLKGLNEKHFSSAQPRVNFPLLSPHPVHGFLTTNARDDQTYDQIGFIGRASWLPRPDDNDHTDPTGYDFGVYRFTEVLAQALFEREFPTDRSDPDRKYILARSEFDISDHLPVWVRIPR